MSALWVACRETVRLAGPHRRLWLPFLCVAFVEALFLVLLWLAPHPPFSALLAPPVRYFFGGRVLHYPWHLWFLFHAMKHTHLLASTLLGAFMSGIACSMVRQTHEGRRLSLRDALAGGEVRYGRILLLWLVTWAAAAGITGAVSRLAPTAVPLVWLSVGLTVTLQALCLYVIPAAVFEGGTWLRALRRGLHETLRYPVTTLAVVALPSAAVIAFALTVSSQHVAVWMSETAPEIALVLVVARLTMWTLADALLTVAAAHLWWAHRRAEQYATEPAVPYLEPAVPAARPALTGAGIAAGLIVAVFALGSAGCSQDYAGERLFWKARQTQAALGKNPSHATPKQFARAIKAFSRVTRRMPGTEWAAKSYAALGSLYALQRDYEKAREAYATVLNDYSQYAEICLGARLATAKTYELEQRWDDAAGMYQQVADLYPWTGFGLGAPLYIGDIFQKQGMADQATPAYARAVTTYQDRLTKAPTPETANTARGYLAAAYQRIGDWGHAAETLEGLAGQPKVNRPMVLLALGSMYQTKLDQPAKAQAVYATLVHDFPEHPFAKAAQAQLDRMAVVIPETASASSHLKISPVLSAQLVDGPVPAP